MSNEKRYAVLAEVRHNLTNYITQAAEADIKILLSTDITAQELKAAIEEALRKLVNNEP